jgi:hypothetical protein
MSAIVYYPAPETPLTREQIAEVIGTALDANPRLLQAFRQLHGEALARATVACADLDLSERAAGHAGGRIAEITSLQHSLAHHLAAARELRKATTGTTAPRAKLKG